MCIICGERSDSDLVAVYDDHSFAGAEGNARGTSGTAAGGTVRYSWDAIADYLTDGYWTGFRDQGARAFVLDDSRTLTYDASRLEPSTRAIAERAFSVWSQATGITFEDIGRAANRVTESRDAGASIATATTVSANSVISGSLATPGDVDYYKVSLTAGQTYLIMLNGTNGAQINSVLKVMGANGAQVAFSNSSSSVTGAESISFTATTSGSYYLVASDQGNDSAGSYELSIQRSADITFSDLNAGASAWTTRTGGAIDHAYVNIHDSWANHHLNGYMLQTYIHEIGHALGLGHAGPYNNAATWGVNNGYANDSWSSSVMSYFDQRENPGDTASYAWLTSLMPADLIAIQNLYGAGTKGNETGDTVWGPGGNLQDDLFQDMLDMWARLESADRSVYVRNNFAFMVYDTAGNDTLDFSAFAQNQLIDLNELARSNVGGLNGNLVIARGTAIENAVSGAGNDRLVGNDLSNKLSGGAGNDVLLGGGGKDLLDGGLGNDILTGGEGPDYFIFNGGRDVITDFAHDTDMLMIDLAALGAAQTTIEEVMETAVITSTGVRFDLAAGHSVELRGITDLASLADDLILI